MASSSTKSLAIKGMPPATKPVYEQPWFEVAFLLGSLVIAACLHYFITHPDFISTKTVDAIAMAKLLAAGEFADVFARMNHPPVYPLLLAALMKIEGTTHVPDLMRAFEQLNLVLYALSIGLVYWFSKQHIQKPWTYVVTLLYVLSPTTVGIAQTVSADMTYTVASLSALLIIDLYFGKKLTLPIPAMHSFATISKTELVVCGIFIGLSVLTRQVGYTLLAAFFFVLLKKFGLKRSLSVLTVIVLLLSPFIGRDIYHVIREPGIYTASSSEIIQTASKSSEKGFKLLQKHTDTLFFQSMRHTVGELNLGMVPQIPGTPVNGSWLAHLDFSQIIWLRWTLGVLLTLGLLYGLAQCSGIGSLYITTYAVCAFVLFPEKGISLAPVLPLLLIYSYLGMQRLGDWAKKIHIPLMKLTGPVLTAIILVCTLSTHLTHQVQRGILNSQLVTAQQNMALAVEGSDRSDPKPATQADVQPEAQKTSTQNAEPVAAKVVVKAPESASLAIAGGGGRDKALQWLAINADKDARIATPRPKAASRITQSEQTPEMVRELRKYDYVVEEGVTMLTGRKNQNPGLKLVYTDPNAGIRIWRIRPENLPLSN